MMTWNPVVGCKVTMGVPFATPKKWPRLKAMDLASIAAGKNPGRTRCYIDAIGNNNRWSGKLVPVPEALIDPFT
jgi:protein gp37